jgi:hypothetical protein
MLLPSVSSTYPLSSSSLLLIQAASSVQEDDSDVLHVGIVMHVHDDTNRRIDDSEYVVRDPTTFVND